MIKKQVNFHQPAFCIYFLNLKSLFDIRKSVSFSPLLRFLSSLIWLW